MTGERKALKDYESALVESGYGEFEIFVTEPSALITLVAGNHVPWLGAKFLIFPFFKKKKKKNSERKRQFFSSK